MPYRMNRRYAQQSEADTLGLPPTGVLVVISTAMLAATLLLVFFVL